MKADYVHKDTLTATDYVDLQKEKELIVSYNQQLLKEKKKLEERIDYLERSIARKEETITNIYNDYIDKVNQNEELKKQLHEASLQIQELYEQDIECPSSCSKLKELTKQQQAFIEYLTSYIGLLNNNPDLIEENQKDILEEVLTKYKEIIGKDINVSSKEVKDEH